MSSQPPLFECKSFPAFFKENCGNVQIYWFQDEFTQSKYPPGQQSKILKIKSSNFIAYLLKYGTLLQSCIMTGRSSEI